MRRIILVTDAWHPQVNGVVTVFATLCPLLEKRGYVVSVIHPGLFSTIPLPLYPEIRLAVFSWWRVRKLIAEMQPDAVHIATEGPLGLAARAACRARDIPFTTSYHTHFQQYIDVRFKFFSSIVYRLMRWFHNGAASTMVATASLQSELEAYGFKNVVLWPLGVDTERFVRNPTPTFPPLTKPVFVFFSRLAPEKSPEEFLALDLPGTKLVIGDGPDRPRLESRYGKTARFVGYCRATALRFSWERSADIFLKNLHFK